VQRGNLTPYLVLASAQIAVGAAAIFARFALDSAPPVAVSASRLAIAAVILFAAAFLRKSRDARPSRKEQLLFAFAGFALALHFVTWIWSLQYISVAVSTLLVTTTPIWTALYDSRFKGRPFTRDTVAGFLVGAAGLALVVRTGKTSPPIPGHHWLGALLAFSGAVAIGAYFLTIREVRHRFGTRTIVTHTYGWAAAVLVAASLAMHQAPPALSQTAAWGGILGMAFVSQLVGHTALNASLRWFSPSAIAFSTLLEPVFAGCFALLLFHETLSTAAIAGAVLVLIAIALVLREETGDVPAPEL